jgi:hypothetical protein
VDVVVLARKGSGRDSILQANAQGKERDQVLLNLVGVRLPKLDADGNVVLAPEKDAEGNTVLDAQGQPVMAPVKVVYPGEKLPPVGSKHFDIIMNQPTGIFVESIYEPGQQKLEELIDGGYLQGVTRDSYNDAKANGNLNRLLATAGMFLRSIDGIFETQQLTVKDIMAGEKTLSISFFGGEAQAFAESFERLQNTFKFQNIALQARISPKMQATQLGEVGISYQPDEVHFFWAQTSVNNRTQYMLDAGCAKSGKEYSSQTVNAANASDLAQRGTQANYGRNMQTIQQGTKNRQFANDTQRQAMISGGIKVPAGMDIDTEGL